MATYWLSFANEDESLGVAIVDGNDGDGIEAMIRKTIALGCNPGRHTPCSVVMEKIPDDLIHERYKNRLLTDSEVIQMRDTPKGRLN